MIQVAIMGGHGGVLRPDKRIFITFMGGAELVMPTVARQILAARSRGREDAKPVTQFFLTIMGGTEIKLPTLAAEFLDLRELVRSGDLSLAEWDRAMSGIAQTQSNIASFTLMGGFEDHALPEESEEIDALAIQRHLGNISDSAGRVLQLGIGQGESERRATIRRAVAVEV